MPALTRQRLRQIRSEALAFIQACGQLHWAANPTQSLQTIYQTSILEWLQHWVSWSAQQAELLVVRVPLKPFYLQQTLTPDEQIWLPGLIYEWLLGFQPVITAVGWQLQPGRTRRQHGSYYTPAFIIRYLLQTGMAQLTVRPDPWHVLDPAMGTGHFLLEALTQLQIRFPHYSKAELAHYVHGFDIDPIAVEIARQTLWLQVGDACLPLAEFDPPLQVLNPLMMPLPSQRYDLIVGNPPYVGQKGAKELFQQLKQGPWSHVYHAKMDLYYFFIPLALELCRPGGRIGLIVPAYFLTATGAVKLRQTLQEKAIVHLLMNLGEWQVFEDAKGQHNLVCLLEPGQQQSRWATIISAQGRGKLTEALLQDMAQGKKPHAHSQVPQNELYQAPYGHIHLTGVRSQTQALDRLLAYLQQDSCLLGSLCQIRQGLVTGADRVTLRHLQQFEFEAQLGDGIFVLNQGDIPERWSRKLRQEWLKPWYKNSAIERWCPHTQTQSQVLYIPRRTTTLPQVLLEHLQRFYPLLSRRREVQQGLMPWWHLHWPREQAIFEGPKLVVPQRYKRNCFAYTTEPWYASADVYFMNAAAAQLKFLLLLLNSQLMYHWLYHRGKRKGRMLELYQQPLAAIPVRIPDASQLPAWVQLADEGLALSGEKKIGWEKSLEERLWHWYGLPQSITKWLQGNPVIN